MLEAFYNVSEYGDGYTEYELNDYGKALMGEDRMISKEELLKLDTNKDGKVDLNEFNVFKAQKDKEFYTSKDLTQSLLSSLDEDGFLAAGGGHAVSPSGFQSFKDQYGELKQFFEVLPNYGIDGVQRYGLNEYGRALAGADGKISKEELMKLDMNGDGKITQEDIDKYKADLNEKKATDLCTYLDCNGDLTNIRSYLTENEAEHEEFLLSNLYDEIPIENLTDPNGLTKMRMDGTIVGIIDGVELDSAHKNYRLNELGKSLAGEDGIISKEELMKLDMDGNGKITQEDIDKYKAKLAE